MTLLEIMVATAIFTMVAFILTGFIFEYNNGSKRLSASQRSRADIGHLLDQWESDQSSADAVFIPARDVFGADNTTTPHEVDFYSKDAANRPCFWAYYYDRFAQTLQRYDYPNPGTAPTKDGNALEAIARFDPSLHAISEVSNAASPIYMPLFAVARDYDVKLGINPDVVGGTHVVHIDLATSKQTIPVELEAGGAPSGFTVVLNYTPAPRPTPLSVWPPALQLPASGGTLGALAYDGKPRDAGSWINAILGGGIAEASVLGCGAGQARAMDGAGWTSANVLANASDPWGVLSTDTNGCISGANGANVTAHEASYYGAFNLASTCGASVGAGIWSSGGPTASNRFVGLSATTCMASVVDGQSTQQTKSVTIDVLVGNCFTLTTVPIGGSCTFAVAWPTAVWMPCDGDGSTYFAPGKSGYDGNSSVIVDPGSVGSGTVTGSSNTDFTFVRTASGTVVLDFDAENTANVKGIGPPPAFYPFCKGTTISNIIVGRLTLN